MLIDFRQLFPKYNIKPKGVMHIGANRGEEFPVYMELGITKQFWYEPNPEYFLKLKETIESNPEALAFPFCVGDENKEVVLHISNNDGQSSSVLELGTHADVHPDVHYVKDITVRMIRIDSLFENYNSDLDFLNIDTQGFEMNVLKGMGELLHNFKWAYLEINKNELYRGCALVEDIDKYLLTFGFKRIETLWCGNTGWGDALYCKQ